MAEKKRITIYFADLVHNYLGAGSYMFPLNIGFISSYAKKEYGDHIDVELFKYPGELLDAIQNNPPDVLSLSNYTWNSHLNGEVAKFARAIKPGMVIVFGGPDINLTHEGYRQFFDTHPAADYYVLCEGEQAFANIIGRLFCVGGDRKKAKGEAVDGSVVNDEGTIRQGKILNRISDVNTIPSPYLTGMLDKFFDYKLIPIIETNRGCPFTCIFCAQGLMSHHVVKYFDLQRVFDELDYMADRVHNTNILCFADANFGIHPRDAEIGEKIKHMNDTRGFPRSCSINWVKNKNSITVAERMGQSEYLVSSLQSLDPEVLKIVKRQNVDTQHFRNIIDHVNQKGGVSGTEIILGLPGETKASHAKFLKELFTWGVSYIICYNCLTINGSEMTLPEYRDKYQIKTKFRLLDSAYGKYGPITSFEFEEGIRSTTTMTEEDILFFRPVHWLVQFLWNYRAHYPLLKFLLNKGINPYDFIIALLENTADASPLVKELLNDFRKEARDEWFDSPDDLRQYYTEHFDILQSGQVGKMNSKYTWRVIIECKKEFDDLIAKTALRLAPGSADVIHELVTYSGIRLIDFTQDLANIPSHNLHFSFDICSWEAGAYTGEIPHKPTDYLFTVTDEKKTSLKVLLDQYRHENINVTLRKMSEHIKFDDLYFDVRPVISGE